MSHPGSDGSPFKDGFAALWHEPALLAAELTWRWCFGFAAWALVIISGGLFLDSLKVSPADEFLLGTLQPQLLSGAVQHIFRGSLTRFVLEQSVLLLGVTLLWCFAATVGRAATLRRLVAMFSADDEPSPMTWQFVPIFVLHLLRAAWSLIALSVAIACLIIGSVMAGKDRAGLAALWLVFGIGLACWFGASLELVLRGCTAVLHSQRRVGDGRSRAIGGLRLAQRWPAVSAGAGLSSASPGMARNDDAGHVRAAELGAASRGGWVLLIMAAIALLYFAGADLLHLARLAAYVSLAEDDAHPVPAPEAGPPPGPVLTPEADQPAEIAPAVDPA